MIKGRSLGEIAGQIKRERDEKKDFIASTANLEYVPGENGNGAIRFNVIAFLQICGLYSFTGAERLR